MKATGIVRRIDELGRVLIPKEVRKILNVSNSDALEVFIDSDNQEIILRKYVPEGEYMSALKSLGKNIASDSGLKPELQKALLAMIYSMKTMLETEVENWGDS